MLYSSSRRLLVSVECAAEFSGIRYLLMYQFGVAAFSVYVQYGWR